MIYRVRTMTLSRSKASSVRKVAARAAAYVNQNYPDIQVEVLDNITGLRDQIHMVTRCASLAALEVYETERQGDTEWRAHMDEYTGLDAVTETVDSLYRVVDLD